MLGHAEAFEKAAHLEKGLNFHPADHRNLWRQPGDGDWVDFLDGIRLDRNGNLTDVENCKHVSWDLGLGAWKSLRFELDHNHINTSKFLLFKYSLGYFADCRKADELDMDRLEIPALPCSEFSSLTGNLTSAFQHCFLFTLLRKRLH